MWVGDAATPSKNESKGRQQLGHVDSPSTNQKGSLNNNPRLPMFCRMRKKVCETKVAVFFVGR